MHSHSVVGNVNSQGCVVDELTEHRTSVFRTILAESRPLKGHGVKLSVRLVRKLWSRIWSVSCESPERPRPPHWSSGPRSIRALDNGVAIADRSGNAGHLSNGVIVPLIQNSGERNWASLCYFSNSWTSARSESRVRAANLLQRDRLPIVLRVHSSQ